MATSRPFFTSPVDRTPYGACAAVVVIALAVFTVGAFGLLRLSSWARQQKIPVFNLHGTLPSQDNSQQLIDQIQQSVQNSADQEKQKAQDAAAKAVKQEVQQEANIVTNQTNNQVKEGVTNTLNNFLK